ncbi:MAG: hypothetical protein ACE5IR_02890 [bacterium]
MVMKIRLKFVVTMLLFSTTHVFAASKAPKATALTEPTPQGHFRFELNSLFYQNLKASRGFHATVEQAEETAVKSVSKATLFSALIPGTGEIYAGSYLKGVAFLVIEAAGLTGHFYYQNRGNDLENTFQLYADKNWDEDDYWDWMSSISGLSRTDMDALRDYERDNFSHFLPTQRSQQYYENIGKYDQFNVGWSDTQNGGARDSDLRENYTLLRKDANDNFQRATTLITVALFNHVISALDAGLTTKRINKKRTVKANMKLYGARYHNEIVPTLTLGVRW